MRIFLSVIFMAAVASLLVGCVEEPPICDNSLVHLTGPGSPFWYPSTNPLMQPIGSTPSAPNSGAIMARQLSRVGTSANIVVCIYDWGRPVYYVGADQSKTTNVNLTMGYGGKSIYGPIRWRECIRGIPMSDRSAIIVDTVGQCVYDAFMLDNSTPSNPSAGWIGGLPYTDANGLSDVGDQLLGGNAGSVALYTSVVWPDECAAGQYGSSHGYVFCAPADLNNGNNGPKYPVTHCDGVGDHPDDLVQGMRVQLNPDFDISDLSTTDQCIAQALKTYGMIDADSGGAHWGLYGVSRQGYTNNPWDGILPDPKVADFRPAIPVSQFRVLPYTTGTYYEGSISNSCGMYDNVPPSGTPPTLSAINPTSGTTAGGTVCTLTGANLTGTTGVSFGGTAGTSIVNVSSTQVRATSPAKSAGTISVTATTANGTSGGVNYTYNAPPSAPTLSAINPTSGTTAGGTACTLTGANLTGCSAVSFGGTTASGISVVSSSQVRASSPGKSAGTYGVTATTANGVSNAVSYTYTTPPGGTTTTLYSPADTCVGSYYPTANYGTTNVVVKKNSGEEYRMFLKWDLNAIEETTITNAKLRLNFWTTIVYTVKVYSCATDSWTETGLTWQNMPAPGAEQASFSTANNNWAEVDVTNYVSSNFNGDKLVTMIVLDSASQNQNAQAYSDETGASSGKRPQLVVISQ